MLRIIGFFSLALAALFLILLAVTFLLRSKSLKVRKQLKSRRRFYSIVAGLFFLLGLALVLIAGRSVSTEQFLNDTLPTERYADSGRISALPEEIFAVGKNYYIRNGESELYGYLQVTETVTDEQGNESEVTSYKGGLSVKKAAAVSGGEGLLAVLETSGRLRLNGAFEYLTYEKNDTVFENKVYSKKATAFSANSNNLYFIEKNTLYSVGYNAFGKLGDGTERNRLEAVPVLKNAVSVSTSETHTLAVDVYGNLYGFGDNSYSEMGNRTTASSGTPEKLMGGVKQAIAGRYFSVVLTKNGEVYTAGRNHRGQLGTGDDRDYATYKKILDGVMEISSCGNSCAALTSSGLLYVWGDNTGNCLGLGGEMILKPTQLAADVYDVAVGEGSIAIIKLNRDVYVTGSARPAINNEFVQNIYAFEAELPEEQLYRETVEMPSRTE